MSKIYQFYFRKISVTLNVYVYQYQNLSGCIKIKISGIKMNYDFCIINEPL